MPVMTYHEIAKMRGINLASARKYAQKRNWRRELGNDGQARIFVPDDHDLTPPPPEPKPEVIPGPTLEALLEEKINGLKELVEAERKRADVEAKRADDLQLDRDAWKHQASRGLISRLFA